MEKRTPGQELIDWLTGITMNVKIMELLILEHEEASKTQEEYQQRFHDQAWNLVNNLKKIKPMSEALIKDGYSRFTAESSTSEETEEVSTEEVVA
jgi:hypothetical protein